MERLIVCHHYIRMREAISSSSSCFGDHIIGLNLRTNLANGFDRNSSLRHFGECVEELCRAMVRNDGEDFGTPENLGILHGPESDSELKLIQVYHGCGVPTTLLPTLA